MDGTGRILLRASRCGSPAVRSAGAEAPRHGTGIVSGGDAEEESGAALL
jgi:hypothetical protein